MSYVEVAGSRTWHEIDGAGDEVVVLLHGGFAGASSWARQVPALVDAGFRVHRPERRGHAHTPDVDGPITYDLMTDDTIAYLEQQVGRSAHIVGWSDGALIGMLLAMRRPDLIDRLVLLGQYYNASGKANNALFELLTTRRDEAMGFLRTEYDAVSPDGPEHFEVFFAKMLDMLANEPQIELDALPAVETPTLVAQGDRDEVTVAHSAAIAAALGNGRLAVLPGTHLFPLETAEVLNPLLVQFLRGGPQAML